MSSDLKPKVVFTFVEAGMGHIMPMTGMLKAFTEKYGEKCEIQSLYPFSGSKHKEVRAMGKELDDFTINLSKGKALHFFEKVSFQFPSKMVLKCLDWHWGKKRKLYLEEYKDLKPDLLVASYYLPAHFASQLNKKGDWNSLIVSYAPDYCTYPAWDRDCDMYLIYNDMIEREALRKGFKREQLKRIPPVLKESLYSITKTKDELKKELGLDNEKITVVYANGAFGSRTTVKTVKALLASEINMNLVVVCGKNQKMYDEVKALADGHIGKVSITVLGFTDKMGEFMKAADICIGKGSANSVQESLYVGTPFIMSASANTTEDHSIEHYLGNDLAIKAFKPSKIIEAIRKLEADRSCYQYMIDNYNQKFKDDTGAEKAADAIYELLKTRYPNL